MQYLVVGHEGEEALLFGVNPDPHVHETNPMHALGTLLGILPLQQTVEHHVYPFPTFHSLRTQTWMP